MTVYNFLTRQRMNRILPKVVGLQNFFRNRQISSENSEIFSTLSRDPSATLGPKTPKIPSQKQQKKRTFLENVSENYKEIINQHIHCRRYRRGCSCDHFAT